MNKYYKTIESTVIIDDTAYTTYGIAYVINDTDTETIFDISLDKSYVESISKLLNDNSIPLVHFKDIVEDYIE